MKVQFDNSLQHNNHCKESENVNYKSIINKLTAKKKKKDKKK